jgi:hypothetical protein
VYLNVNACRSSDRLYGLPRVSLSISLSLSLSLCELADLQGNGRRMTRAEMKWRLTEGRERGRSNHDCPSASNCLRLSGLASNPTLPLPLHRFHSCTQHTLGKPSWETSQPAKALGAASCLPNGRRGKPGRRHPRMSRPRTLRGGGKWVRNLTKSPLLPGTRGHMKRVELRDFFAVGLGRAFSRPPPRCAVRRHQTSTCSISTLPF